MSKFLIALLAFGCGLAAQDPLAAWLDARAQKLLAERDTVIAGIRTVADAEKRKAIVRTRLLESLGGLPTYSGPLNARLTGKIDADGYVIEKVLFESLPGFFVTANVYRPVAAGKYPAVLLQAGHTQEGKVEPQITAANLALQGYVALTFDPIGQGEREQTYLPILGRALSGGSVNEHLSAGAQSMWIGQSSARYFIFDAKRAIDYLISRADVDGEKIGAAGCSGGGALTVWIGALDERVKAAAPACYINTYKVLFAGPNPDSEMSLPGFLARGLDMADMVEMTAPKPWLLLATEEDYFVPGAARVVYDEARRWYAMYGAEERVRYFVGPGPHGTPVETREEIYAWMDRWLRGGKGGVKERPIRQYTHVELRVSETGHVEGRKVHEIIRDQYREMRKSGTLEELKAELRRLGIGEVKAPPVVEVLGDKGMTGYRVQQIRFTSEPGVMLTGQLYLPESSVTRSPAVLLVEDVPMPVPLFVSRSRATAPLAALMAKRGMVVLELSVRDSPSSFEGRPFVGNWLPSARADMVGLNMAALRTQDLRRGLDVLAARSDVDASSIRGVARGVKGIWLLQAAAIDTRVRSIWLDRTPRSIAEALDRPHGNFFFDVLIPGFLLKWDLADLEKLMGTRAVYRTDHAGWMGEIVVPTRWSGEPDDAVFDRFLKQ
ncbi:MAG: acetylxylan esterase [Acidobacteria bacterium]|nr:acetylxylan esterase [Acidobacteriota bacterium]